MSKQEIKFRKDTILTSKQFTNVEKDILSELLKEDSSYDVDECKKILQNERERVIK